MKIIAIGGGELKSAQTLPIERYIAGLVNKEKPVALFVPTASHDSKPYFNSFRKTYTGKLGCKSDVALLTTGEMCREKILEKMALADIIYVGGGDTAYMLSVWEQYGFVDLLRQEGARGKILCGLSAGANCWFSQCQSDYLKMREGSDQPYRLIDGLGFISAVVAPHYGIDRKSDFEEKMSALSVGSVGYGIEDCAALEFTDGILTKVISDGAGVYQYKKQTDGLLVQYKKGSL